MIRRDYIIDTLNVRIVKLEKAIGKVEILSTNLKNNLLIHIFKNDVLVAANLQIFGLQLSLIYLNVLIKVNQR